MTTIERIDRVIANCRATINETQYWNDNRTDESPLDCEVERVVLAGALRYRRAVIAGDMVAAKREADALVQELDAAVRGDLGDV